MQPCADPLAAGTLRASTAPSHTLSDACDRRTKQSETLAYNCNTQTSPQEEWSRQKATKGSTENSSQPPTKPLIPQPLRRGLPQVKSEVNLLEVLEEFSSTLRDENGVIQEERLVGEIARPVVARIRR